MRHINIEIKMERVNDDDPEDWQPIALLRGEPAKFGWTLIYSHVGQHSEAFDLYLRLDCRGVESTEDIIKAYALLQELKSIGYDIGE